MEAWACHEVPPRARATSRHDRAQAAATGLLAKRPPNATPPHARLAAVHEATRSSCTAPIGLGPALPSLYLRSESRRPPESTARPQTLSIFYVDGTHRGNNDAVRAKKEHALTLAPNFGTAQSISNGML